MMLAMGATTLAVLAMSMLYWGRVHSTDLGTMSQSWIAEYNASHPNP